MGGIPPKYFGIIEMGGEGDTNVSFILSKIVGLRAANNNGVNL